MTMTTTAIEMQAATVRGQQREYDYEFPLVLKCDTPGATLADGINWAQAQRDDLIKKIGKHGAILFRGLLFFCLVGVYKTERQLIVAGFLAASPGQALGRGRGRERSRR